MSRFLTRRLTVDISTPLSSFRHGDDIDTVIAEYATHLYQADAPTAAAYLALEAWFEGDEDNYELWSRIFQRLHN